MKPVRITRRASASALLAAAIIPYRSVNTQMTPFGLFGGTVHFFGGPPLPVFLYPGFPMGGQARPGVNGEPIIIVDSQIPQPFLSFVLAHEYAHHALNHISQLIASQMMNGPLGACFLTPRIEIEADTWATHAMRSLGNVDAVQAAFLANNWQGYFTQSCYPSGIVRAQNIRNIWING